MLLGMGHIKSWLSLFFNIVRPVGIILGGLAVVFGLIADISGDATFWSLTGRDWINVGIVMIALFGAIAVLRLEYLMHEFAEMWGNEHARKLAQDGIYPERGTYFQYLRNGEYATVVRFWAAGFVNISDSAERTDLHIASENGHAAIVRGILERGGDPKRHDNSGRTPLMIAASRGHVVVAEALSEHDCAIQATATNDGVSALYAAASNGYLAMAEFLIRAGARLDSSDHDNITPLMAAIVRRNWAVAQRLIDAGADVTKVDHVGATLRDYALLYRDTPADIISSIVEKHVEYHLPRLVQTGVGHAGTGKVNVQWREAAATEDQDRLEEAERAISGQS